MAPTMESSGPYHASGDVTGDAPDVVDMSSATAPLLIHVIAPA
eukprot:CAMPEP_0113580222 /NCGR_PEP_ID=MMETSP0015_2-20120614/30546_1 /TAXON_ID=2838 /ORGANISM="Odontella" /LENGTH=42 /DNA_ID=CAMNT_0000484373 /DNA_START=143 /DNA_END=267 /DNA_ORIENTATION=+ /assembly_acc=CAM_ASM_000160